MSEDLRKSTSIERILDGKPLGEVMADGTAVEYANYRAKSDFNSKTMIINGAIGIIALIVKYVDPSLFPTEYAPFVVSGMALLNMALRKMTKRPTAFIPPGETAVVKVEKL